MSNPAWRTKVSWYFVAMDDRMIPPPAQRAMADRARATVREAPGSHSICVSQPAVVAELIEQAAAQLTAATDQWVATAVATTVARPLVSPRNLAPSRASAQVGADRRHGWAAISALVDALLPRAVARGARRQRPRSWRPEAVDTAPAAGRRDGPAFGGPRSVTWLECATCATQHLTTFPAELSLLE